MLFSEMPLGKQALSVGSFCFVTYVDSSLLPDRKCVVDPRVRGVSFSVFWLPHPLLYLASPALWNPRHLLEASLGYAARLFLSFFFLSSPSASPPSPPSFTV